jgi:hypothetical protein
MNTPTENKANELAIVPYDVEFEYKLQEWRHRSHPLLRLFGSGERSEASRVGIHRHKCNDNNSVRNDCKAAVKTRWKKRK